VGGAGGAGLDAVGWADDGSIEAVESTAPARFLAGVLWHPEQNDERLFAALVEAARARRAQRRQSGVT
jgi:putative glutamine amidotransferase